jgi:hypothetical protein
MLPNRAQPRSGSGRCQYSQCSTVLCWAGPSTPRWAPILPHPAHPQPSRQAALRRSLVGICLYNINIPRSPRANLCQSVPEFPNWYIRAAIQRAARQERQRGSRGGPVISRDLRQEEVKRENAGSGSKVTSTIAPMTLAGR